MDEAAPQAAVETTLGQVVFHWGDAYKIRAGQAGYTAERRDGKGEPLTAATPGALWDLIVTDYTREAVPRDCDPPSADPDVLPLRRLPGGRP